jgi:ABC-2 type transport system permease protein
MVGKRIWHDLGRIARLWRLYASLDLLWLLRDAQTVVTYVVSDAIVGIASAAGTFLLAERFGGIGRWTTPQVIFMLGYALVVAGVPAVLFNYNVAYVSRRIGRGQLDHLLIQPQPIWMALLTEGFAPFTAAMTVLPGIALLIWATGGVRITLSVGWLALLLLNIVASVTIALAFNYLWGSLAFWAPRAAEEINSTTWRLLDQLKPFPLDGIWPGLLGGLLSVVPVGFMAWYPARALLGLDHAGFTLFVTPLAAIVFVAFAVWIFRRGMHHYEHTGSQRYLALGHRS